MSALTDRLRERIRFAGPITFYEWMKAALYDPEQGYYCRADRERWGREGDYRTSPERSLLFGATFARYFARLYKDLGSPRGWTIVEVGAGAGHFAEAMLETLQQRFPEVFSATRYFIDEASAESRSRAQHRLARFGTQVQFQSLVELDLLEPGLIFSNELLDAFPVNRVILQADKLREFYVGVNEGGSFEWIIGEPSTERLSGHFASLGIELEEGQIAEANLEIEDLIESSSQKIRSGYLIAVDYGAEASVLYSPSEHSEGTLRAFHQHQIASNVLASPGEQDITSSVNWTLVKMIGANSGFEVVAFERQDRFLLDAGLLDEMELRMGETLRESEKLRLRTSAREMILPGGLAQSFQVLVMKRNTACKKLPLLHAGTR